MKWKSVILLLFVAHPPASIGWARFYGFYTRSMLTVQGEIWWNPEKFFKKNKKNKTALWIFSVEDSSPRFRGRIFFPPSQRCSQSSSWRQQEGNLKIFVRVQWNLGIWENSIQATWVGKKQKKTNNPTDTEVAHFSLCDTEKPKRRKKKKKTISNPKIW